MDLIGIQFPSTPDELREALRWLDSLGVPTESTRLAEYRRIMDQLKAELAGDGIPDLLEVGTPLLEAAEFVEIHQALAAQADDEVTRRLRQFVHGPDSPAAERPSASSNLGRNIGFELYVGARLRTGGLTVHFDNEGDLWAEFRGFRLFLECKRPQNSKGFRRSLRAAAKQLRRRYRAAEGLACRGLIAVSVTKVIDPSGRRGGTVHTWEDVSTLTAQVLGDFERQNEQLWRDLSDPRTLGVLLFFRALVVVWQPDTVYVVPALRMNVRKAASILPADLSLLDSFSMALARGRTPGPTYVSVTYAH